MKHAKYLAILLMALFILGCKEDEKRLELGPAAVKCNPDLYEAYKDPCNKQKYEERRDGWGRL